jgi:uncharacterized protein YjiK
VDIAIMMIIAVIVVMMIAIVIIQEVMIVIKVLITAMKTQVLTQKVRRVDMVIANHEVIEVTPEKSIKNKISELSFRDFFIDISYF